ncbi:MAG: hypothetical protein V2I46_03075 [Bacteroides sp.]|jgi:hypothetical protein|nr:hypothetical protein [Bacteroides sp.]
MSQAKPQGQQYRLYFQFVLIGAAIGLYYGLFYRASQTEPDFGMAIILSFIAALVTVVIRSWKKGRTFKVILIDFLKILAMFLAFMIGLELRKVIYELWGKTILVIFTTGLGILVGLLAAIRKKDGQVVSRGQGKEGQ